jgi:hypothetical protein
MLARICWSVRCDVTCGSERTGSISSRNHFGGGISPCRLFRIACVNLRPTTTLVKSSTQIK